MEGAAGRCGVCTTCVVCIQCMHILMYTCVYMCASEGVGLYVLAHVTYTLCVISFSRCAKAW